MLPTAQILVIKSTVPGCPLRKNISSKLGELNKNTAKQRKDIMIIETEPQLSRIDKKIKIPKN